MLGLGNNLNELKTRIQKLHQEISDLGQPILPLENMIDATNTLRQNEFLTKSDSKKTELIEAYSEYVRNLEQITSSLFSIQAELKDLIKTEAALIESAAAPKKTKKAKKST